jgi:hypothetical protein
MISGLAGAGVSSARFAAMGGGHSAAYDDFSTFYTNPAAINSLEKQFSVAEISANVHDFMSWSKLLGSKAVSKPYTVGMSATGPISAGYIGRHWGISLVNSTFQDIDLSKAESSKAGQEAPVFTGEKLSLNFGYAWRPINYGTLTLDIGLMVRASYAVMDYKVMDPGDSIHRFSSLLSSLKKPSVSALSPAVDAGALLRFKPGFALGMTIHDIYSPFILHGPAAAKSMIRAPDRIQIGFSWKNAPTGFGWTSSYNIYLDYSGLSELFATKPRSQILDLSAGIELNILQRVSFRVGLHDLLPTAGLGFRIGAVQLDLAFYGEQFGTKPGEHSSYSASIGILFQY